MKIIKKIFKKPSLKILRKKRGQAVIEYTLLLVVGVGIAWGLKKQFMDHFNNYTQGLFDSYYVCLMETAVLPGMAASCSPATFEPGAPSGSGSSNNSNRNTSSSSPPSTSSNNNTNNPSSDSYWSSQSSKRDPLQSSSSAGIGGGGGGSSSSFPVSQSGASRPFSSPNNSFPVKASDNKNFSSLDSSFSKQTSERIQQSRRPFKVSKKQRSKLTSGQASASQGSSSRFLNSAGSVSGQEKKEEQIRGKSAIPAPANQESSAGSGGKREQLILDEKTPPPPEKEEETSFNFGKWMKYILIAVIAGVILFFVGSQAAQMRENLKAS